ncbi:DUF998 domain-containing protein [Psychromarinibacter sp. C21-152]|uniref:DUF998 domain-containing protein n=1 Tax=Psychromarinibacter sediminicola TaxID=3033385 RepID=A0AAE3NTL7_9RHOB|nr:DUF998 domain-containing protein [Psychromarinibacter sediminicola]MDF0602196.1 DUF998 domain-containing protein [Psychromarinibacter sediminicola]
MTDRRDLPRHTESPRLLVALSLMGVAGAVALIGGTIVAQQFVPNHDWIADTISDLAAGPWEIVMDVALYGFAGGIMATALAAAHAHLGRADWSFGVLSLALLAVLVTIIAARNEYGDGDSEGIEVHTYLVYALAVLFAAAPFLMARGVGRESPTARRILLALGAVWALSAPVFYLLPSDIDGLYERALGLIACAVLAVLWTVFLRRGRRGL